LKNRSSGEKTFSNEPVLIIGQKEEVVVKMEKNEIEKIIEQELLESENRMSMRVVPEGEQAALDANNLSDEDDEEERRNVINEDSSEKIIKKLHRKMARRQSHQPPPIQENPIGNTFRVQGSVEDFDNCRMMILKVKEIEPKIFDDFANTYSAEFKAEKNAEEEEKEKSYIQATAEFTYKYLFWKKSKKVVGE
jgi:hypothetical protein